MHEYAITENIIKTVTEEAKKAGADKITKITLVIGDLSSIVDESVQMYFDIISKGTIAQEARLEFKRVSAEYRCISCGTLFTRRGSKYDCPECGGEGRLTDKGREFYIESIEVD
ncbi:MAG: hydrogenase maturation nickel metallochaperone HypA [Bacillota bacterium]|nr:hydrogenase maturation nickel metallochaperone HypA [Bacillota bacterium]